MDSVVRLFPNQQRFKQFQHDLLDMAEEYKNSDDKVLANMWKVRRLVGQFLYYWPITEPMLDDMVSAGLLALNEYEDWDNEKALWYRIRHCIEVEINKLRSVVYASFSTNRNRSADGKPLEYGSLVTLHGVGRNDDELAIFELVDSLTFEDQEEVRRCQNGY